MYLDKNTKENRQKRTVNHVCGLSASVDLVCGHERLVLLLFFLGHDLLGGLVLLLHRVPLRVVAAAAVQGGHVVVAASDVVVSQPHAVLHHGGLVAFLRRVPRVVGIGKTVISHIRLRNFKGPFRLSYKTVRYQPSDKILEL